MGAGDRRAALLGVEGDRQQGKEGGACRREMGRPEQRPWKWADGGWHSVAPPSCEEAQGHSPSQLLQWGGSRGASGRWWSSTDALEQTQKSFPSKTYSSKHTSTKLACCWFTNQHPPGVFPAKSLCPIGFRAGKPPAKSPPREGPIGVAPPDEP